MKTLILILLLIPQYAQSQCTTNTAVPAGVVKPKKTNTSGSSSFGLSSWQSVKWNSSTLRVQFLDGTAEQRETVRAFALDWAKKTNISLLFHTKFESDIRITFDKNDGSHSRLGNFAKKHLGKSTMNFAWLDKRVVLHEFGHAFGFPHEHLRSDAGIKWNKNKVYQDLAATNGWSKSTVDQNVFNPLISHGLIFSKLDFKSIMTYPVPQDWTLNNVTIPKISELSKNDIQFTNKIYSKYDNGYTCNNYGAEIKFDKFKKNNSQKIVSWEHHCNPLFNFKITGKNSKGQNIWQEYRRNQPVKGPVEDLSFVEVSRTHSNRDGVSIKLMPNGKITKQAHRKNISQYKYYQLDHFLLTQGDANMIREYKMYSGKVKPGGSIHIGQGKFYGQKLKLPKLSNPNKQYKLPNLNN